ncbi:MAG: SPOR domain-containing protein [Bryobacterales bacterium]|nr:SPOR domain-containing protein [Bryobacterales bacterium]
MKTAAVKPEPAKPEPVKPAKPEPVKTAAAKPEPVKPAKPEPVKATGGKLAGSYFQVVATKSGEAAGVIAKLSAKGFPATTQAVPDSTLVRVLVGPIDAASMGKTKSGLEAAGYKPMARKF